MSAVVTTTPVAPDREQRLVRRVRTWSAVGALLGLPLAWMVIETMSGPQALGLDRPVVLAALAACVVLGAVAVVAAWSGHELAAARLAAVIVMAWVVVGSPLVAVFMIGLVIMIPGLVWVPLALYAYALNAVRHPAAPDDLAARLRRTAVIAAGFALVVAIVLVITARIPVDPDSSLDAFRRIAALSALLVPLGQVALVLPVVRGRWRLVATGATLLVIGWAVLAFYLSLWALFALVLMTLPALLIARDAGTLAALAASTVEPARQPAAQAGAAQT